MSINEDGPAPTLTIAVNADSLDSWFLELLRPMLEQGTLFSLRFYDQDQTHDALRKGEVIGCIGTEADAIRGCRVVPIGGMNYRMLCTPYFMAKLSRSYLGPIIKWI